MSTHVPHGVKSTEVGGTTLDAGIAEELALGGPSSQLEWLIKAAKEKLSSTQVNWDDANLSNSTTFDWNGQQVELTADLIKRAFVAKVWPAVDATLDESLEDLDEKGIVAENIHIVVLAGGTCQMGLVQRLVEDKLRQLSRFSDARFIVSADYRSAVAQGLAIEAAANSRHHEMMPSRVSAYLQEDLKFECGHNGDDLYLPIRLRSDYKSQGDLANGILLKAPKEIGLMLNRPRTWRFRLKQGTRELFYRFSKLSGADDVDVLLNSWQRLSRSKDQRPGRQLILALTLQEDGFARLTVDTNDNLSYELEPIDLHDLSGLEGDTFFAVDFGTDNSQVAYVNVKDPDLLQPLPSSYSWDRRAERRARDLVGRVETILGSAVQRNETIIALNEQEIIDYVYHSNRIEGSLLDRGDTQLILNGARETLAEPPDSIASTIGKLGIIDEQGQIMNAPMLIKDPMAAVNLRDAFRFVQDLSHETQAFSAVTLRQIHELTMKGDDRASPGSFRKENVAISQTSFVPPDFVQVDQLCQDMLDRLNSDEFNLLSPIIQAVEAHARFVSIHPFSDGNGRVARLLANYFMWRENLPGILLPWENRDRYYDALEECNSKEPGLWGNLTDLINLFCDVLESSVEHLEEMEADAEDAVDESAVVEDHQGDSEFTKLIAELKDSGKSTPLKFEEQYDNWFNAMSSVISEVKELSSQLSRVFRAEWQGAVHAKDYPLIDLDTYRAIRTRQRFARTWCLKIELDFLSDYEELVFYFGSSSRLAHELNLGLRRTCSLHVSRFVPEVSRHVQVAQQQWSRLMEITHDGSNIGVVLRDQSTKEASYVSDEGARVENWFGMLVKDVIDSRTAQQS